LPVAVALITSILAKGWPEWVIALLASVFVVFDGDGYVSVTGTSRIVSMVTDMYPSPVLAGF
jgi:hypothetical protein